MTSLIIVGYVWQTLGRGAFLVPPFILEQPRKGPSWTGLKHIEKLIKHLDIIRKNKERLWEKACERYQNLSEEEKNKKENYYRERYRIIRENEKQGLTEYIKSYSKIEKTMTG